MKYLLLCDFGSTYTKLTAVDRQEERVAAVASAFTSVKTDISEGFEQALSKLKAQLGEFELAEMRACSSAAGGLAMIVSGLVPELTAEAARMAALGAGAKVVRVFAHELTRADLQTIKRLQPDIFLLTGGTDGGNSRCLIHNAQQLAQAKCSFPILVAGNRSAQDEVADLLEAAACSYQLCPNVMPKLGVIAIAEVQERIRELFLQEIVKAKGLSKISSMVADIILPTPAAVLAALQLLARGYGTEPGIGDLLACDPGGATTDVYSLAAGEPQEINTVLKGLPEPYAKRSVEGDIGMRYSLDGLLAAVGLDRLAQLSALSPGELQPLLVALEQQKDILPQDERMLRLEQSLAALAVEVAVKRHCGSIEEVYTPLGKAYAQVGKDLRSVRNLVLTGGALVNSPNIAFIAQHALWRAAEASSLRPKELQVLVDRKYILSAMGVLAQDDPSLAIRIMKKELVHE